MAWRENSGGTAIGIQVVGRYGDKNAELGNFLINDLMGLRGSGVGNNG